MMMATKSRQLGCHDKPTINRKEELMFGEIFVLWITLALLAGLFGGRAAAGRVMSASVTALTSGISWMLRGILGSAGSAIVRVVSDIHNYCYSRQPGFTVLFYLILLLSLVILGHSLHQ